MQPHLSRDSRSHNNGLGNRGRPNSPQLEPAASDN